MPEDYRPIAVVAIDAPSRSKPSNYPEPFASQMAGRVKRQLGDLFRLESFGVNHVTMSPGGTSALFHQHSIQDEFVFVLSGEITLMHDLGETVLRAGMCAGFRHGGRSHQLLNKSGQEATYVEVGDRQPGDTVTYKRDDLVAVREADGWSFAHKDGRPY